MIKSALQSSLTNDVKYRNLDTFNVPSNEYLIETNILGSNAASVTFSSLGQYAGVYQHLQLRITARTNRTGADSDPVILRFNGDTGNNYITYGNASYGSSSTVTAAHNSSGNRVAEGKFYIAAGGNYTVHNGGITYFDLQVFNLQAYRKGWFGRCESVNSVHMAGDWNNTADLISSILLYPQSGNFNTGSEIEIWGCLA